MTGKKERQRKLAAQRFQRQQVRRAERARRWRLVSIIVSAIVVVAGLGTASFLVFGGGSKPAAASSATPTPTPTPTPSASSTPSAATVAEPAHHCAYTSSSAAARKVNLPAAKPDYKATYQATIKTNRGTIVINLLNSKATCTVNSFVSLATQKYFNNTPCHRLTTSGIYVLQCGDPTGTGTGGPGYKFNDENLAGAKYTAATLAMANSGPNTNGSQFFLVYQNSTLSPNYTPFGTIASGLGIIQNVAKAGTSSGSGDGPPKEKVVIESVHITKT